MFNPGEEISSLDFGAIIGGSLNAVVKAQSQSAQTTVNFIKNVGFQKQLQKNEDGTTVETDVPINVAFSYDKEVSPSQVLAKRSYSVEIAKENDGTGKEVTLAGEGYTSEKPEDYRLTAGGIEFTIAKIELNDKKINNIAIKSGDVPEDADLADGMELKLEYLPKRDSDEGSDKNADEGSDKNSDEITPAKLLLKVTTTYEKVPAVMQKMQIQVPILTMMPIPFIKIDSADIDFNVKINSVSTTNDESKSSGGGSTSVKNGWFVKAELNAAFSNQKSSSSTEEVKKDYSLNVKVHAAQDDMPAGVSRILDMLEDSIKAQPVGSPVLEKGSSKA